LERENRLSSSGGERLLAGAMPTPSSDCCSPLAGTARGLAGALFGEPAGTDLIVPTTRRYRAVLFPQPS